MIPIDSGKFTDAGYRFRRNTFDKNDNFYPMSESTQVQFYDIIFYNSDTFAVDETTDDKIAEIYFRLGVDEMIHTRDVYNFMDWLGDIGGIKEALMSFFVAVLGGYV